MTERSPHLYTCPACGKLCFPTRRDARRNAGAHGTRRRAYRCPETGAWHLASYQPVSYVTWYRERGKIPGRDGSPAGDLDV